MLIVLRENLLKFCCYYMHVSNNFFCVLNFYIGKFRVLKFREDLNSRVFNFANILQSRKTRN